MFKRIITIPPSLLGGSFLFAICLSHAVVTEAQDEIVVHAYKQEQPLKDLPISVSVLSADYLDQRQYQTLEQVSATQPGLTISKNSNASKIFLRGIGSQGNAGMEQSAATFIDGVYHGRSRSTKAALVDLEQVEILKGPQSIHLGVNSSAGAISIKTRGAALDETKGYLETNFDDYGEFGVTAAYNLAVTNEFAVRAVINADTSGGFWDMVDPVSGDVISTDTGHESELYRLSGLWQPSQNFQARLKTEKQVIDRENPYAWQPGRCDNLYGLGLSSQSELDRFWQNTGSAEASPLNLPFSCEAGFVDGEFDSRSPAAPYNRSAYTAENLHMRLNWDLGDFELLSISSTYDVEFMFEGNDLTHGALEERYLWAQDDNRQSSQEFRLLSKNEGPIQYMVGAYWHSGSLHYETGDADRRNARNPQFIQTLATQKEKMASLYSEVDWQISDRLNADLGLRWTQVEKTFSGIDQRIRSNTVAQDQRALFARTLANDVLANPQTYAVFDRQTRNQFTDETRRFSNILPSITLGYRLNERSNLYYRWVKGYKAGGINFRLNGLDQTTLDFDAETVFAHELGVKADLLEQKLSVAAAIFLSDYKGLQQNSNRGDDGAISAAVIRNAARARSDGFELELSWRPLEAIALDWSATLLDARFDDYQGADCTRFQSVVSRTDVAANFGAARDGNRCSQDLSGGKLAHAPEISSRAALTHNTLISDTLNLATSVEWFYSDRYFTSPHADPLRSQAAFHKFNGRLGLSSTDAQWKLDLVATNLTNKLTARQLGQDEDAAVSGLLDDPRRIILNLRYSF